MLSVELIHHKSGVLYGLETRTRGLSSSWKASYRRATTWHMSSRAAQKSPFISPPNPVNFSALFDILLSSPLNPESLYSEAFTCPLVHTLPSVPPLNTQSSCHLYQCRHTTAPTSLAQSISTPLISHMANFTTVLTTLPVGATEIRPSSGAMTASGNTEHGSKLRCTKWVRNYLIVLI